MQVNTQDLEGVALHWALAKTEGVQACIIHGHTRIWLDRPGDEWAPTLNQVQGSSILDEYGISTIFDIDGNEWQAATNVSANNLMGFGGEHFQVGPTRLIAGLRCRVAMKHGLTIEIPDELMLQARPAASPKRGV